MKKVLSVVAALVIFAGIASAMETTPVRVSLVPGLAVPFCENVQGLDLGLLATKTDKVTGLQLGWISATAKTKITGLQDSWVNHAGDVVGVQMGIVNIAENVTGLQYGLINVTKGMNGVQIGLINYIKSGPVPIMVLVNAKF